MLNVVDVVVIVFVVKCVCDVGVIVVVFDVLVFGVDVMVMMNNVQVGEKVCQYIVDQLGGKGDVVIVNGLVSFLIFDWVKGCKDVLVKLFDIKILLDDQNVQGLCDGGLNVGQMLLMCFDKIDGVFVINDLIVIGFVLVVKQVGWIEFIIIVVDGVFDIEGELKFGEGLIKVLVLQDFYMMVGQVLDMGYKVLQGEIFDFDMVLLEFELIIYDNIGDYKGWIVVC